MPIKDADELRATMDAIDTIHDQLDELEGAYEKLPKWAWIRQNKNLRQRISLLRQTKPHWDKLNEGMEATDVLKASIKKMR